MQTNRGRERLEALIEADRAERTSCYVRELDRLVEEHMEEGKHSLFAHHLKREADLDVVLKFLMSVNTEWTPEEALLNRTFTLLLVSEPFEKTFKDASQRVVRIDAILADIRPDSAIPEERLNALKICWLWGTIKVFFQEYFVSKYGRDFDWSEDYRQLAAQYGEEYLEAIIRISWLLTLLRSPQGRIEEAIARAAQRYNLVDTLSRFKEDLAETRAVCMSYYKYAAEQEDTGFWASREDYYPKMRHACLYYMIKLGEQMTIPVKRSCEYITILFDEFKIFNIAAKMKELKQAGQGFLTQADLRDAAIKKLAETLRSMYIEDRRKFET